LGESYQSINTISLQNVDMSQEYFNPKMCYQILINQSIPIQSNNFIVKQKNISIVMHEKLYCLDNVGMECYNYFIMKQHLFLEDFLVLTFMTSFRWILNKSNHQNFPSRNQRKKHSFTKCSKIEMLLFIFGQNQHHSLFCQRNPIVYIKDGKTHFQNNYC
jgi:hypothetical protein